MFRRVASISTIRSAARGICPSKSPLAFSARSFSSAPVSSSTNISSAAGPANTGSVDGGFEKYRIEKQPGDEGRRDFVYFMLGGGRFVYVTAARLLLMKFVGSMSASADVLALASAEFDTSNIAEGSTITVKWRGKPIFIRHRTDEEIEKEEAVDIKTLKDSQTDAQRVQDPKWLIVLGICTHLGCVPISNAGEYGGWFCPCHGSHYDTSGRIRKGPAPLNLEIPPYKLDGSKLLIG